MFYCIIVPLAWLVWHIAFRIHVVGREHLIQGRGFVLAPNHISAIDPVFVVLARFWGRRMIVLGKEELFEVNPFVTWFLRHVGVVPVHRGKGRRFTPCTAGSFPLPSSRWSTSWSM